MIKRKYIRKKNSSFAYWFSAITIIIIIIISIFILPKAEINIFLEKEPININSDLKLDSKITDINFIDESIPMRAIYSAVPVSDNLTDEGIIFSSFEELNKQKNTNEELSFDLITIESKYKTNGMAMAKVKASLFCRDDLQRIVRKEMDSLIQPDKIFLLKNSKIKYSIKEYKPADNQIILVINAENYAIANINKDKIKEAFLKKKNNSFLTYISENYNINHAEIKFWPFNNEFLKKLLTSQRIYINIIAP